MCENTRFTVLGLKAITSTINSLQTFYRISAAHQPFYGAIYTKIDPTWINRCRISLRSIQVRFKKVFTLVQIDLSSHLNSDSFRSVSDSFRLISVRFRFALRKCQSHSFRYILGSFIFSELEQSDININTAYASHYVFLLFGF